MGYARDSEAFGLLDEFEPLGEELCCYIFYSGFKSLGGFDETSTMLLTMETTHITLKVNSAIMYKGDNWSLITEDRESGLSLGGKAWA